jgi:hypothetical protein
MKDVTAQMIQGLEQGMDPQERKRKMETNQGAIILEATEGTHYDAEVIPFFYGNAYYLFVYEKFRDVRLVGAPPVSIGNFGADLDNWVWPRHTGDFSLFRVYGDAEGNPADYHPDNIPYKPRKHLEINISGVDQGDFTMVMGNPGRTSQYLHSAAVEYLQHKEYPLSIGLRTTRLEIMDRHMKTSEHVRIQYAHKYRKVSNAWKKWQGVILGLNRNRVVEMKIREEAAFTDWMNEDGERQMRYDHLLEGFENLYRDLGQLALVAKTRDEAVMAVEVISQLPLFLGMMRQGIQADIIGEQLDQFYKDFHMPVDREVFAAMMEAIHRELPREFHPEFFREVEDKFKGDFHHFANSVYRKTILGDPEKAGKLLDLYRDNPGKAIRKLESDPITDCFSQFMEMYLVRVNPDYIRLKDKESALYKTYMAGLLEMHSDSALYPDANGTMRVAYGKVDGYLPGDGIVYHYATTLSGVMEKRKLGSADYAVPDKLVELYEAKDYGPYGVDGTIPVCFLASNHTSGGNSGSPVLDAEGRLIGLNFDREWEGTMSDLYYDPSLCRNIAVDIRYVLFVIDKYAGAGYLLEEMDIVR